MHKTGIEDHFIIRNNKKLRCGYTTGSCAAAAAKAAALMLFSGHPVSSVPLMTPKGIRLDLEILDAQLIPGSEGGPARVTCAVRKDGGDDPDATNGLLVYAAVQKAKAPGIHIDGGRGVGRVTRRGMLLPVGEAAINPVPRQMIREEVAGVADDFAYDGGLDVTIFIPEGEAVAAKTFNPRLGIEGGISVLGTSGIVVPMSETALLASIRLEMEMLVGSGHRLLLITPGNYGETFSREEMRIDLSASMKCSNYVGETLDMAVDLNAQAGEDGPKIDGILFVAHVGKFIKVAGGIMNTHSRDADCRAELMAAFALRAGCERSTAMRILDSATTDEALEIMEEAGVRSKAMELAAQRVRYYLQHRVGGALPVEAVLFSGSFGYLTQTEGAEEMLRQFAK